MERYKVGTLGTLTAEVEAVEVIEEFSGIASVPGGVAMVVGGNVVRVMGYAEMWGEV